MDRIALPASPRTPLVDVDFALGTLVMRGESYPEDAAGFFGPLHKALADYLKGRGAAAVTVEMEMAYFNSSSAKALMNMFQLLETAARSGTPVTIQWRFAEGDETMQEFGEEFAADFEHATFELCPHAAS